MTKPSTSNRHIFKNEMPATLRNETIVYQAFLSIESNCTFLVKLPSDKLK